MFMEKGNATGVKILGKGEVSCDAVVICTGAYSARLLADLLRVRCPVLPIKTYTFDIQADCLKHALIFLNLHFTAVPLEHAVRV